MLVCFMLLEEFRKNHLGNHHHSISAYLKETAAQLEDQASPRACPSDWHRGKLCSGPTGPRAPFLERPHPGLTWCSQWLWPPGGGGESAFPEAHAGRQEFGACGPWPHSETFPGKPEPFSMPFFLLPPCHTCTNKRQTGCQVTFCVIVNGWHWD